MTDRSPALRSTDRVRSLTREQKLRLIARAAMVEKRARADRIASADDGAVLRVPVPRGRPLLYFLSPDDLEL